MKNFKLALIFMLATPSAMMSIDENIKKDLEMQARQLKSMLAKCNDAYINSAMPMHEQSLTFHWYLTYFIPFRYTRAEYSYNSEVLLAESKKLSDVITTIEKLQESEINNDAQINELIKMFVNCNDAYMHNVPMYKQELTVQWYLQCFFPFRNLHGGHCYNSEVLLTESKRISDVILAMVNFKNNKTIA